MSLLSYSNVLTSFSQVQGLGRLFFEIKLVGEKITITTKM